MIPVEEAEMGMVLAENVSDRRGRLLMPAGRVLEEKHLHALPMWGVTHIEIEWDEPESEAETSESVAPWAMAQAGEEIGYLFLHANTTHPVMQELNALRVRRRAMELQRETHHEQ